MIHSASPQFRVQVILLFGTDVRTVGRPRGSKRMAERQARSLTTQVLFLCASLSFSKVISFCNRCSGKISQLKQIADSNDAVSGTTKHHDLFVESVQMQLHKKQG